jgi:hypothetical protein
VLSEADLAPIVDAALVAWQVRADIAVVIVDLPGLQLGDTDGSTIFIDADAAGHGWFVDLTPADSLEFDLRLDASVLAASPTSDAYGRMDLLTVLMHEIGHTLGFTHEDVALYPVMREDLSPGMRIAWGDETIDWHAAPHPWTVAGRAAGENFAEFRV